MVEGKVSTGGSLESRVKIIYQGRGEVDPVIGGCADRFPISGVRTAIPVTGPKGDGGRIEQRGMIGQRIEKGET
jgi:hypothetical protein